MGQTPQKAQRPEFRNIHISDIRNYRLPLAGKLSILHRASGVAMFLALPFVLALVSAMFTTPAKFASAVSVLSNPLVKLIALGLTWAIMHHMVAGIRYLLLDAHVKVSKEGGHQTALIVFAVSIFLTLVLAIKMFI